MVTQKKKKNKKKYDFVQGTVNNLPNITSKE